MAIDLGAAYIAVVPETSKIAPGVTKALGGAAKSATGAGASIGSRLSAGVGKTLKRGIQAGGLAGGALLGTALTKGFGRLKSIEQAEAKLTGLGHSAGSVEKIMTNATAAVTGTAFGLDEAATTAAGAVAAGIKPGKDLEKTLTLVGDASTIAGTGMGEMGAIFNKVAASNKVQGDVINQLQDKGIPIVQLLGKEMGKSADEVLALSKKGKIGFGDFEKAMQSGLGGAAQEGGKTFSGAMANVMASLGRVGAGLLSGVFPKLAPMFQRIQGWMQPLEAGAKRLGAALGDRISKIGPAISAVMASLSSGGGGKALDALKGALANLAAGFKTILPAVVATFQAFKPGALKAVKAAISGVLAGVTLLASAFSTYLAPAIAATLGWMADNQTVVATFAGVIGTVVVGIKTWAIAQAALNAVMAINPIGLVVVAIAGLAAGLVLAYKKSETFRAIVNKSWAVIRAATLGTFKVIRAMITTTWNVISAVFKKVLPVIATIVRTYFTLYRTIITTVFTAVKTAVTTAWNAIKGIVSGAVRGVLGAINGVKAIVGTVRGAFESARAAVAEKISAIITIVTGIKDKVLGALSGAGSWLTDIGKNIVQGLVNGIDSVIGWVRDKINALADMIPGWVKKKLGIASPSKVMRALGKWIPAGLAQGIEDGSKGVRKALDSVTKQMTASIKKAYKDADPKQVKAYTRDMTKWLRESSVALRENGRAQDWQSKRIAAATKRIKAMRDMSAGLRDSLRGELDLGSLFGEIEIPAVEPNQFGFGGREAQTKTVNPTFASVSGAVKALAARAKTFAQRINQMSKKGIPQGLIQEVAGLGSEQGIAVADALLSGSQSQIKALQVDFAAVQTNTKAAGDALAKSWFGVGVQAQQGLLDGMVREGKRLDQAAKRLANRLTKALKKALGIKSPSVLMRKKVGFDTGRGVGAGTIDGMDAMQPAINRRAASLVSVPRLPTTPPSSGVASGYADPVQAVIAALEGMKIDNHVNVGGREATRIVLAGQAGQEVYA